MSDVHVWSPRRAAWIPFSSRRGASDPGTTSSPLPRSVTMPRNKALHQSSKEELKTMLGFKWDYTFEALWAHIKEHVADKPWHLMSLQERASLMASIEQLCAGKEELDELLLDAQTRKIKEDGTVPNAIEALVRKASKQRHEKRTDKNRRHLEGEVEAEAEAETAAGSTRRPFYDPARGSIHAEEEAME